VKPPPSAEQLDESCVPPSSIANGQSGDGAAGMPRERNTGIESEIPNGHCLLLMWADCTPIPIT
jgi:hypothetical protein